MKVISLLLYFIHDQRLVSGVGWILCNKLTITDFEATWIEFNSIEDFQKG